MEGLQHLGQFAFRDARAVVLDRQHRRVALARQGQGRLAAIVQGVLDDVADRPLQRHRPGLDRQVVEAGIGRGAVR
jgi:hypothetical protein